MYDTIDPRKPLFRIRSTAKIIQMLLSLLILISFTHSVQAQERGIDSLRQTGKAFAAVAKKVSPAVVFIQVEMTVQNRSTMEFSSPFGNGGPFGDEFFRCFFGPSYPGQNPRQQSQPQQAPPQQHAVGQGSGFIILESSVGRPA